MNNYGRLPSPFRSLKNIDPDTLLDPVIPEPFIMPWEVTDKNEDKVECVAMGFYDPNYDELVEVTLLDRFKNDITLLFMTDDELDEMISHYKFVYKPIKD